MNNQAEKNNHFSKKIYEYGYTYIRQIGQGASSKVHLVYSHSYNQYFALKQSKSTFRFEICNEFEILKQLIHPHIINLYSILEIDFKNAILFEYCSGGTLADLIKRNGPIRPPKLYKYCFQILSAVEYIHQNHIAHLDIKPSNILLDAYDRIKISDFGLSQKITSISYTEISGLNMFMPPEVWDFVEGYDRFLADIYSLGVTFYFMSQGRSPFVDSAQEDLKNQILNGDYPPPQNCDSSFALMICQMMKIDPKERPPLSELIHQTLFKDSCSSPRKNLFPVTKLYPSLFKGKCHSIQYDQQISPSSPLSIDRIQ